MLKHNNKEYVTQKTFKGQNGQHFCQDHAPAGTPPLSFQEIRDAIDEAQGVQDTGVGKRLPYCRTCDTPLIRELMTSRPC